MSEATLGPDDLAAASTPLGSTCEQDSPVESKRTWAGSMLTWLQSQWRSRVSPVVRQQREAASKHFARGRNWSRKLTLWVPGAAMATLLMASGFLFEGWELVALLGFSASLIGWSGLGMGLMVLALGSLLIRHARLHR